MRLAVATRPAWLRPIYYPRDFQQFILAYVSLTFVDSSSSGPPSTPSTACGWWRAAGYGNRRPSSVRAGWCRNHWRRPRVSSTDLQYPYFHSTRSSSPSIEHDLGRSLGHMWSVCACLTRSGAYFVVILALLLTQIKSSPSCYIPATRRCGMRTWRSRVEQAPGK